MDERMIGFAGGVALGLFVGAGGAYLYMRQAYTNEFNRELKFAVDEEVAATKKFYSAIQKDKYPTPGDLAAEVSERYPGFTLDEEKLAEAKDLIEGHEYGDTEGLTPVARNVFTDYANTSTWDAEAEEAQRDPSKPYVISSDEFFENAEDRIQTQLIYFAEDGVLADTQDKPVDDSIVGEDNLQKFGHGSKDPNIVYVCNESMELDFEIMYAEGKYAEQVQGFIQHGASPSRGLRKFRLDDE